MSRDAHTATGSGQALVARMARLVDAYWRAPVAPTRLAWARIVVGGFALIYLIARVGHLLSYATMARGNFAPVGVVDLVLDRPLLPLAVRIIVLATIACGVLFVLGWRHLIVGPVFAALLLFSLSYRNSFGMIFHTENLLVMHVLILGVTRSADAYSLDARRRGVTPSANGDYGWPLRLMAVVVAIAYVLAGVAKLKNGGLGWVWGDELKHYIAIDNARKLLLGDVYSPLAAPLMGYDVPFKLLAVLTVAFELGAPLALLGRRWAILWVAGAVAFHLGVLALMFIAFPYQMLGVAYAPLLLHKKSVAEQRALDKR